MNAGQDVDLVLLGVIAGAHGIGGEVRVFAYNESSDNLRDAQQVRLRSPGAAQTRVSKVQRSRKHKQFFLLKLDGIDDRDAADAARGIEVLLRRDELQPAVSDEVYLHDLVGIPVADDAGRALGVVREVMAGPATDILVVAPANAEAGAVQHEHLIACHEGAFVELDVVARRIVVRAGDVVTNRL